MATALPPTTPQDEDERYNPANDLYEREFNAGQPGSDAYKNAGIDQAEAFANDPKNASDPTKAVRDGENNAGNGLYEDTGKRQNGRRKDSAKAIGSILASGENPLTLITAARKAGPLGLIISIILGAGAFIFGGFSLLPVHLYENFLSKFDSNNTSYTIRTNKVIASKLSDQATSGDCNFTGILCRFQKPSNYMLKSLGDNGITPIKNGEPVQKTPLGWPNARPDSYQFTDSAGNTHSVTAKDLRATLAGTETFNNEFRAAFHSALRTRLQTFSDSVFKTVAAKFGFSKQDPLKDAKTEKDVDNAIADETDGTEATTDENGDIVRNPEENTGETSDEIKDTAKTKIQTLGDKVAESGYGNAVGTVAGLVCTLGDGPGIIIDIARAYQMAQLVRFGALFMTTASALKAGDATPQEVSAVAGALTAVYAGKSALDSFGVHYALFGDTAVAKGSNYLNYVPGGKVSSYIGDAANILDSDAKQQICATATSPITGVAIDAAVSADTLGIGDLVQLIGGTVGAGVVQVLSDTLIPKLLDLIPADVYANLGKTVFGDITTDLQGQNYGDALTSGVANTLGQLSNAGGNVPLSVGDAVAYDNQTQQVNHMYALEDQATHSPFDMSTPNTMMGALVDKLTPLYSQMGSLSGVLSSVSSIAGSSLGSIFGGSVYAADDAQQYTMCNDPGVSSFGSDDTNNDVAADPFCNIQYGIPPKYLDMDPQQIVSDLVNAGQIDAVSGEAVPDAPLYSAANTIASTLGVDPNNEIVSYSDWLSQCTDGTTDEAVSCQINDAQTAEYALYTIDHRIQKNIDNQDIETAPDGTQVAESGCTGALGATYGTTQHPFSCQSPWNTPLPANPKIDPNSAQISQAVLNAPDRVVNMILYSYGQPVYTSTAATPYTTIGGSSPNFTLPLDPSWRPNEGGDSKMNIFDTKTKTVYELDGYNANSKTAYWGVKHNYVTGLADGYPTNGEGTGPTGSGMSQVAGMVRISDITSGSINHALSFITSNPQAGVFRYPASGTDGSRTAPYGIQEGMRIQLDPNLDLATLPGITKGELIVGRALQKYGAFCSDNGGNNDMAMGFYAEKPTTTADPYPGVGFNGDWAQLSHIPKSAYRVIDASVTVRPKAQ